MYITMYCAHAATANASIQLATCTCTVYIGSYMYMYSVYWSQFVNGTLHTCTCVNQYSQCTCTCICMHKYSTMYCKHAVTVNCTHTL